MKPIIRVENLGKQYRIGRREAPYATLRESLNRAARAPFDRLRNGLRGGEAPRPKDRFWSLKEVSFEVLPGDVVGVIGGNGAGKSTLLKILSRITEPTTGKADLFGRVGSLLEVGTGFHPELTGRENIFLNGAIYGMAKSEIKKKYGEIVDFADMQDFIHTPIKHYSSGMMMRLAFSVAAHMEPEILVVDEVLAVGDAQFQKKCLGKIQEVSRGGRTILFVSHNMSAVRNICNTGFLLEHGRLVDEGDIDRVVNEYLSRTLATGKDGFVTETQSFVINDIVIESGDGTGGVVKTFDPVRINISFTPKVDIRDPGLYVGILTNENERIAGLDFKDFRTVAPIRAGQTAVLGFSIESFPLLPGFYRIEIHLKDMACHKIELVPRMFEFALVDSPVYGGRKLDHWFGRIGLRAEATSSRRDVDTSIMQAPAVVEAGITVDL